MRDYNNRQYSETPEYQFVKLVNGAHCNIKSSNLIGVCHSMRHKGYISKALAFEHKCLQKDCNKLEKFSTYPFWTEKELAEKQKKNTKEKQKAKRKAQKEVIADMVTEARAYSEGCGFPVIVTNIIEERSKHGSYIVNYVSDSKYDDSKKYSSISKHLNQCFEKKFTIKKVKHPNGGYASVNDFLCRKQ